MSDPNIEAKMTALEDQLQLQREFIKVLFDLLIRTQSIMMAAGMSLDVVKHLRKAAEEARGKL